jgi:Sec-independent protein translocase protein TatA
MSTGQLLLTVGVALWVFDAEKMPQLVSNLARTLSICQRYYHTLLAKGDALLQQEMNKLALVRNELKAKQAEASVGRDHEDPL